MKNVLGHVSSLVFKIKHFISIKRVSSSWNYVRHKKVKHFVFTFSKKIDEVIFSVKKQNKKLPIFWKINL